MRGNFVLAVRTWCWKCYFKTTKLFVTNFSFERSKQNPVCCPWDISDTFCSRLLLVGPWEIDVPAGFAVPCELNNSVILLPEQVARFCAAGSSHASRVCRPSLPLVPGAKRCKCTHGNLTVGHSAQVHSSAPFLGPRVQPHTLWHSVLLLLLPLRAWSAGRHLPSALLALCVWHGHLQLCCAPVLPDGLLLA